MWRYFEKDKPKGGTTMRYILTLTLLVAVVLLAACGTPATPSPEPTEPSAAAPTATEAAEPVATAEPEPETMSGEITLAGSTSVQPVAENLANAFMAMYPDVVITVQGGGSSVGVKSAGEGTVDIGNASREIKDEEFTEFPNLVVHTIARDGIAIVVHPEVAVDGLTKDQVKGIYEGSITMWDEVGGPSVPIIVVGREEGSGTRGAFGELVMGDDEFAMVETAILQPSNGAVVTTVSTTPDSIGFISFGYIDESTKPLAMDGVEPTVANALSGDYPVVRPLNMLTNGEPTGVVKAFLDFVFSDEGQAIVVDEGYLGVE
jgi:phosphate transport system substrate-binding protein